MSDPNIANAMYTAGQDLEIKGDLAGDEQLEQAGLDLQAQAEEMAASDNLAPQN